MESDRGYTSPELLSTLYRYRRAGIITLILAALSALATFVTATGWVPDAVSLKVLLPCVTGWFIAVSIYALFRSEDLMSRALENMDRTAMKRLERMARTTEPGSSHDYLYLKARLDEEKARVDRHGGVMSLLYMELADFSDLQIQYGEKAAEELLDEVADLCGGQIRQYDALRRIFPDRYLILLPHTNRRDARHVAEGLLDTLYRFTYEMPSGEVIEGLKMNVGVAAYPMNADNVENLVSAAHNATRQARSADDDIVLCEDYISTEESGEEVIARADELE